MTIRCLCRSGKVACCHPVAWPACHNVTHDAQSPHEKAAEIRAGKEDRARLARRPGRRASARAVVQYREARVPALLGAVRELDDKASAGPYPDAGGGGTGHLPAHEERF